MNLDRLVSDIKDSRAGEGFRGSPYLDSRGCTSIGYGRNLLGNPLTSEEGEYLLRNDLARIKGEINRRLPWVNALDDVRQRVFHELAYNMGIRGLLSFVKMLAAAEAEDWLTANAELLNSSWSRQVQLARRDRLASMLLTGEEL